MVARWKFTDPGDLNPATNTYTVPRNPNAMTSIHPSRTISAETTTAIGGQALFFEGNAKPTDWTFSGDIVDAAHYEALRSWVEDRRRRITITDHFGRDIVCVLVAFAPTPKRAVGRYWRHTYDIKALVISVGAPDLSIGNVSG